LDQAGMTEKMVEWINEHIDPYGFDFELENLGESMRGWNGALTLCALFDTQKPCNLEMEALTMLADTDSDPEETLDMVIDLFERHFEIPKAIEGWYFVDDEIDEEDIATYMSLIYLKYLVLEKNAENDRLQGIQDSIYALDRATAEEERLRREEEEAAERAAREAARRLQEEEDLRRSQSESDAQAQARRQMQEDAKKKREALRAQREQHMAEEEEAERAKADADKAARNAETEALKEAKRKAAQLKAEKESKREEKRAAMAARAAAESRRNQEELEDALKCDEEDRKRNADMKRAIDAERLKSERRNAIDGRMGQRDAVRRQEEEERANARHASEQRARMMAVKKADEEAAAANAAKLAAQEAARDEMRANAAKGRAGGGGDGIDADLERVNREMRVRALGLLWASLDLECKGGISPDVFDTFARIVNPDGWSLEKTVGAMGLQKTKIDGDVGREVFVAYCLKLIGTHSTNEEFDAGMKRLEAAGTMLRRAFRGLALTKIFKILDTEGVNYITGEAFFAFDRTLQLSEAPTDAPEEVTPDYFVAHYTKVTQDMEHAQVQALTKKMTKLASQASDPLSRF